MAEGSLFEVFRNVLGRPVSLGGAAVLAVFIVALVMLFPVLRDPGVGLAGDKPLEVSALIRKVKEELQTAEHERLKKNELALFELQDFEMEIHFVVRNTGEVSAEVIGIGSKADVGTEHVQKLTLRWKAIPGQEKRIGPSSFSKEPDVVLPAPGAPTEGGKP